MDLNVSRNKKWQLLNFYKTEAYGESATNWVASSGWVFLTASFSVKERKSFGGNYQVHGCSISVVRSHQKPRKKRKGKVSSLLMIILQLDRSRVQSLTLGLSLRSQTSVLRCKMDSAAKQSHRQARDTDNLLSLRFSFNGENVILPMFSRRVKQDSRVIFQATLLSFLPKFPSENYAALYWAQMLSISNKHLLNKKQAYLEKIPRPLAPAK